MIGRNCRFFVRLVNLGAVTREIFELAGVLDIDSPTPGRFGTADQRGVELLCETFLRRLERDSQSPGDFI